MKNTLNWKKMIGVALTTASVFAVGVVQDKAEAATITVQQGQTLSKLANDYGTTVKAIKKTNNLNSDKIIAGSELNVPLAYKVTHGDSLWYLAKKYHTTVAEIMHVNGMHSTKIIAGHTLMIPVGTNGGTATPAASKASVQAYGAPTALHAAPHAEQAVAAPQRSVEAPVAQQAVASNAPTMAGMTYKQEINMVATAYGPSDIMWQFGGLTYTGTKVRQGVVAVDPSVVPLGSKVFITGYNSPLLPAGGFVASAEDVGGAIKGDRVDIYMNGTKVQLDQFGMQNVKMYILK